MNAFLKGMTCLLLVANLGCVAYRAKPLSANKTAAEFEARILADPGLKAFIEKNLHHEILPWPPKTWNFSLLTLAAFYYHPDLDVARAEWGTAKAGVLTAGERPNPEISLVPEFVSNPDIGNGRWIAGVTLDIPLETAGKRGYRIEQAKHKSHTAYLNIATVAWQVRSRLRKNLLALYAARQEELILTSQLKLEEENVQLLRGKIAENSLSPFALTNAQLSFDETTLSLRDAQKREADALAQVAQSLGIPSAALKGVHLSFDFLQHSFPRLPADKVQRAALLNRPDILGLLSDYAAAESALKLEVAKQYPDIHLGPGYTFDQGENKWALGIGLSLPIFSRNKGPIAEAEASRTETAARFTAFQAEVIGEIEQTSSVYLAALKKLGSADALLSSHRKKQQFIEEQTGTGELRRVALLQTHLAMSSAEVSRLNSWMEAQESLGLLEDAVQQPLEPGATTPEVPADNLRKAEAEPKL